MTPRFQADADQRVVLGLRRRQPAMDFQDARAGGMIGLTDSEVLARSAASGRTLVFHDRNTMPKHFARFLAAQSSPGLLVVPQCQDIGATIEDLLLIWATSEAEEWRDKVVFLPF